MSGNRITSNPSLSAIRRTMLPCYRVSETTRSSATGTAAAVKQQQQQHSSSSSSSSTAAAAAAASSSSRAGEQLSQRTRLRCAARIGCKCSEQTKRPTGTETLKPWSTLASSGVKLSKSGTLRASRSSLTAKYDRLHARARSSYSRSRTDRAIISIVV